MEKLFQAFSQYIPVSDQLKLELQQRMQRQAFPKNTRVLNAHQVCKNSYYIENGIMRLYYLKDGREISEFFCTENEWMNSPKSFMMQTPDHYFIDVIEDTVAWTLHVNDLVYLFNQYPEMEKYARLDMGSTFVYIMERLASVRFASARERYEHFLATYPAIQHRIPLGMVASYVGVAQETLSRLRRKA